MTNQINLRTWRKEDAGQLASIANNRNIWLNVRDHFPHPYTINDALQWIEFSCKQNPVQNFAIEYNHCIVGSIGVVPKEDVYRISIEIGYFIGEPFWGKGIASRSVALILNYIANNFKVVRVYAEVFDYNTASIKVLEKNGFHLESVRQKAVLKNNIILNDQVWVKFLDE